MSGRKRTKRKNSEDDFDVDEDDDALDNDDTNKWSCQSCTFMNRAAAYRCFVCGTRKGTSTRRSRMDDNVVEMQKTITTMVQKQVEKEKSMKRRERSLLTSVPREIVNEGANISLEIKQEMLSAYENDEVQKSASGTPAPVFQKVSTPDIAKTPNSSTTNSKVQTPEKMESTPPKREFSGTPAKETTFDPETIKSEVISCSDEKTSLVDIQLQENPCANQDPPPTSIKVPDYQNPFQSATAANHYKGRELNDCVIRKELTPAPVVHSLIPMSVPATAPAAHLNGIRDNSILQHLPERVVKKLNQPNYTDQNMLLAHKRLTGIDPIVADSEAVLLPQDWSRQMVMRGLGGSNHYVSPTTSRQSSETDSSSSEANKSLDAPLNDISPRLSKSCQIPDYMIHRESPQKIFIVANGFPAYFEEFPRRIPQTRP